MQVILDENGLELINNDDAPSNINDNESSFQ
jgi:hypothetical protein